MKRKTLDGVGPGSIGPDDETPTPSPLKPLIPEDPRDPLEADLESIRAALQAIGKAHQELDNRMVKDFSFFNDRMEGLKRSAAEARSMASSSAEVARTAVEIAKKALALVAEMKSVVEQLKTIAGIKG